MKPMMSQVKDNAGLLGIVAALLVVAGSFSQLEKLAWLIGAPSAAYAGQAKAEEVDDKFERYLERQEAYTEALQDYVQQQQAPNRQAYAPMPSIPDPQNFIEYDQDGTCWVCEGVLEYDECYLRKLWRVCEPDLTRYD